MPEQLRLPPDHVETTPTSANIVTLREAARALGKDPRTVKDAIIAGRIRGGAQPYPQRMRWYVYTDQLPAPAHSPANDPDTAPETLPQPAAQLIAERDALIANQRAQIVTLEHNNRLLSTAVDELLDALEDYKAGGNSYRDAAAHFQSAADGMASSLRRHRDALAQLTTPGHLGDLVEENPAGRLT